MDSPIELNGYWVNSVSVEDVEFLELEWQDSSRFIDRFRIEAKTWTYEVDFPMEEDGLKFKCKTKICLHQFPIVLNHATTVHKLQGVISIGGCVMVKDKELCVCGSLTSP